MSRLWWVCAVVLWISTPLSAQQVVPHGLLHACLDARQEAGLFPGFASALLIGCEAAAGLVQQGAGLSSAHVGASLLEQTPAVVAVQQRGPSETAPLTRYEAGLDLLARVHPADLLAAQTDAVAPSKKSPGLAVIYSLLLPGMGELYAGGFSSGKYFLIAEGVLWLGYVGMQIHADQLRDGARSFSLAHAGVDATGKDDDFYVNVGNFMSLEDYNDKKLRDRTPDKLYDPLAGYSWRWDSELSRQTFRDQRINSENWYNGQKFVGAAIIINHIVSAVNAARAAISYNNAQSDALGSLQLSSRLLGTPGQPHGVLVTIARGF